MPSRYLSAEGAELIDRQAAENSRSDMPNDCAPDEGAEPTQIAESPAILVNVKSVEAREIAGSSLGGINNCGKRELSFTLEDAREKSEFAHLKPVIDSLPGELTVCERQRAVDLICRYADIFSRYEYDVGCTNLVKFQVDTGDHKPISEPLRSHPRTYLDAIDNTVDKMLQAGIIEESSGEWCFNVVPVKRASSNEIRLTVDLRRLNAITHKDQFPLPRISDCLDELNNSKYFSTLDVSNSFYNIPVDEAHRDKLSFRTRKGQFRFRRMTQGSTNSSAVYTRLMSLVLKGLPPHVCVCFVDDAVSMGADFDSACTNLEAVFARFKAAGLKLKPSKVKCFQLSCIFLSHIVSERGLEVCPDKVACIATWKFPDKLSGLRAFLGASGYYRAFCPSYATVAEPLYEMLRKGGRVEPTERRIQAFERLKQFLTSPPLLALPRDEGDYVLDCDASLVGAGAVLQQYQDGKLRVIEYASRTFNRAERNYCSTRREFMAVIFGLKIFRLYLLGRHFLLRVDNQAITYFRTSRDPTGQLARHLDFLADFDFDIQYRSGPKSHLNADAMSRLSPCEIESGEPCRQCNRRVLGSHSKSRDVDESAAVACSVVTRSGRSHGQTSINSHRHATATDSQACNGSDRPRQLRSSSHDSAGLHNETVQGQSEQSVNPSNPAPPCRRRGRRKGNSRLEKVAPTATASLEQNDWSPEFLREQQLLDPDIHPVISWIEGQGRPAWDDVKPASPFQRSLWQQYESLIMRDGALYRIFHDSNGLAKYYQYVLPASLKVAFLELAHADSAGHLKFTKCVSHVIQRAWWHTWRRDLKLFIDCCHVCSAYHRGAAPHQGNLKPMLLGGVAERWAIDLTGTHPLSNGFTYLFTAIDPFSKFGIAVPIRNKEAVTVARVLVEHVILKYGLFFELLSDLGREFENEVMTQITAILGINKLRTTAFKPSTNGVCENWHKVLNSLLAKTIAENQRDWSECIKYVTFCYNATSHSSTNFSPFFLMYGRQPMWNVDFYLNCVDENNQTVPEYAATVLSRLNKAFELTRQHLKNTADYMSTWYNRKVKVREFKIGDTVRVYNPRRVKGRSPKWQSFYKDVATVQRKLNDVTYIVKASSWKQPKVIHVDKLKLVQTFHQTQ